MAQNQIGNNNKYYFIYKKITITIKIKLLFHYQELMIK